MEKDLKWLYTTHNKIDDCGQMSFIKVVVTKLLDIIILVQMLKVFEDLN